MWCDYCDCHLDNHDKVYCKFYQDEEGLWFEKIICPHYCHEDIEAEAESLTTEVVSFVEANDVLKKLIFKSMLGCEVMEEKFEVAGKPVVVEKSAIVENVFNTQSLENLIKERKDETVISSHSNQFWAWGCGICPSPSHYYQKILLKEL